MDDYPTPADLAGITDTRERVRAAGELARAGRDAVAVRDEGILELLRAGERPGEVGELAGVAGPQMTRYVKRARGEAAAR